MDTLGGDQVAGGKMKTIGTVEAGDGLWDEPNIDATNENGFSAIPAGTHGSHGSGFDHLGVIAFFWSSTAKWDIQGEACWVMNTNSTAQIFNYYREVGFSVRCIKD